MNRWSVRTHIRRRPSPQAVLVLLGLLAVWSLGSPANGAQPPGPVFLATGQFGEIDGLHKGEGKALIIMLPDGQRFLRFEDFKVTNGPDLYVYLSGHAAPRDRVQLHQGAAFEVGQLKGNIGNQNYALPAEVDLSKVKSVAIYCKRFSVIFSTAELVPRR